MFLGSNFSFDYKVLVIKIDSLFPSITNPWCVCLEGQTKDYIKFVFVLLR